MSHILWALYPVARNLSQTSVEALILGPGLNL